MAAVGNSNFGQKSSKRCESWGEPTDLIIHASKNLLKKTGIYDLAAQRGRAATKPNCHSEERSDEESLYLKKDKIRGFFAVAQNDAVPKCLPKGKNLRPYNAGRHRNLQPNDGDAPDPEELSFFESQ